MVIVREIAKFGQIGWLVYILNHICLVIISILSLQVASFPFDDHNCPPIQLIISFCQSAYSWLKEDIENVVVVHCKAGMARTGLMISSLLLYLKVNLIKVLILFASKTIQMLFSREYGPLFYILILSSLFSSSSPRLRNQLIITIRKGVLMGKGLFCLVRL